MSAAFTASISDGSDGFRVANHCRFDRLEALRSPDSSTWSVRSTELMLISLVPGFAERLAQARTAVVAVVDEAR